MKLELGHLKGMTAPECAGIIHSDFKEVLLKLKLIVMMI